MATPRKWLSLVHRYSRWCRRSKEVTAQEKDERKRAEGNNEIVRRGRNVEV